MNLTTANKPQTPAVPPSIHDLSDPNLVHQFLNVEPANLRGPENQAAVNAQATAWLTNDRGRYALNWQASNIGYWDWIGLFPNPQVKDNEHVDWTWIRNAKDGSYRTNQAVQLGIPWEARYFAWDYGSKKYVCIARGGLR